MTEMKHVRFRMSELVSRVAQITGQVPSVTEALDYYWGWALNRGWELVSMLSRYEGDIQGVWVGQDGQQLEWGREETWDVVWRGEDCDGGPDLLFEVPERRFNGRFREVCEELKARGWERTTWSDSWKKSCFQETTDLAIAAILEEVGPDPEKVVDAVERMAITDATAEVKL